MLIPILQDFKNFSADTQTEAVQYKMMIRRRATVLRAGTFPDYRSDG
jgi:hypothetical protein